MKAVKKFECFDKKKDLKNHESMLWPEDKAENITKTKQIMYKLLIYIK